MGSEFAWPERITRSSRPSARLAAAGIGLVAAAATAIVLSPQVFRAQAVVITADPTSPLAAVLPRTAAEVAVSKPVMQRAAESLIGTGLQAPEPGLIERLAIAASVGGTKATGKAARLAADISRGIEAKPGAFPGSLEIFAASEDAERSAQIAAAVAESLVAEQDDSIAKSSRVREADTAGRLERLKADAAAARRRLSSLGGVAADPEQVRAAAAAQTTAAKARVDTIKAILASGSPPLSDRRDVPSAIEALQASYLDLSRQLAKARETLGDRHTTIISLQAEVKHAAASLTAEWRRLSKLAEGELAATRDREASLRKADTPADASRRAAIEEARRSVLAADDAVARAQTGQGTAFGDERPYRLLSRPAVPIVPVGVSLPLRALLAFLSGLLGFGLARVISRERLSSLFRRTGTETHVEVLRQEQVTGGEDDVPAEPRRPDRPVKRRQWAPQMIPDLAASKGLMQAMVDLLPEVDAISPSFGSVPTIIIAANDSGVNTTPAALALGRAVAESGQRTLLIEVHRPHPELAAAASEDEDPILLDLFGALRVGLRADTERGLLYFAPSLEHGARIAAALARGTETPVVDDIGAEFDLIIIDGGEAEACAAAGWGADTYLRVGRFESRREDIALAETFDVPHDMILGTIAASSFHKTAQRPEPKANRIPPVTAKPLAKASVTGATWKARSMPARPTVPRRRVGAR